MSDRKKVTELKPHVSTEERNLAINALGEELQRRMVTSNALVAAINYGGMANSTILIEELQHVREIGGHMAKALENLTKGKV